MTYILVVEDEPRLRSDLVDYMAMRGFEANGVGTAKELHAALEQPTAPDVIILDVGLPDGNGFDLAMQIRNAHDCGIIMLTARGDSDDRIRGFESGADIYLVKHSTLREIEASVHSLLRRLQEPKSARTPQRRAGWILDIKSWNLIAPAGDAIKLTATEVAFLNVLIHSQGETCRREDLAQVLARPQTHFDRSHLDAIVSRLRRKVEKAAGVELPIKVVYGLGYAFSGAAGIED